MPVHYSHQGNQVRTLHISSVKCEYTLMENTDMRKFLTLTVLAGLTFASFGGCGGGKKIEITKDSICCDGGYEYRN